MRAVRVIHPFPTLANVFSTLLFALIAQHGEPPADRLVRLLVTMFCIQSSIGAANDAFDVELDRESKPWKPIVAGALSRRSASILAVFAAAIACAVAATFGWAAWLVAMGGLLCGLSYDAGLKRTPASVVTYLLALPLLPLWIWLALGIYTPGLLWEYPFGVLIGLALYLGNTAPDVDADADAGVRGLAHRLGTRRSAYVAWGALAIVLLTGPLVAPLAGYNVATVTVAAGLAAVALAAAVAVSLRRMDPSSLRLGWGLMIGGSLVFALGWLSAAP